MTAVIRQILGNNLKWNLEFENPFLGILEQLFSLIILYLITMIRSQLMQVDYCYKIQI